MSLKHQDQESGETVQTAKALPLKPWDLISDPSTHKMLGFEAYTSNPSPKLRGIEEDIQHQPLTYIHTHTRGGDQGQQEVLKLVFGIAHFC